MSDARGAQRLRTLDVGCGIHKQPGSIGIDRNPASRADVLADLDRFPYPFADSAADDDTYDEEALPPEDLDALHWAVEALEHPTLAARLGNLVGKPIELMRQALPAGASI